MEDCVMAAGKFVKGMPIEGGKKYWLWQAERCLYWHQHEPQMRWEMFMYFYLFKWAGYEG